jgi:3-hydroxyisobutyryl-CoA hydrolase
MSFRTPLLLSLRACRRCMPATMPLRSKINHAAFSTAPARLSSPDATEGRLTTAGPDSLSALIKEQPGDDPDDVMFTQLYGLRTIELNRPKKLNSLNGSMARKIIGRLKVGITPFLHAETPSLRLVPI